MRKSAVDLQRSLFLGGLRGEKPKLPLRSDDLRLLAKSRLSPHAFDYLDGGAGREQTCQSNLQAFERWKIVPRMLKDVSQRDVSIEMFGCRSPGPMFLCPIGVLELMHRQADLAVVQACNLTGTPMMISSQASNTMEQISEKLMETPRFFQLYWSKSIELVESFVTRAEACGCCALVVTLDTTLLGWRVRDLERAYLPFLYGMGLAQYLSDPVFNRMINESPTPSSVLKPNLTLLRSIWQMARNFPGSTWQNFRAQTPLASIRKFIEIYMNPALQWNDLNRLRGMTKLPVILKGIQHPDDARKAVDYGMDGVLVSNHGGRQVDGAIGSLDALHQVKQAIGAQIPILFDSGIRSGSDVFKAIALGARAVGIGRPYAYALAANGIDGVKTLIDSFNAEFELTMALTGCNRVSEITPDLLQRH